MLSRREFLALSLLTGASNNARTQTAPRRPLYRDYSLCFPDYLRDLATQAYNRRNLEISKLTTPAAIKARQQWVAETFWRLVGGKPERTPLNARTVGGFARDGYRLEKVIYESQPNFYVSGNLYIPTSGNPPYPGVLFQMGHSANGKAGDLYQRCCQSLARLGYVVLGFDPMGQGERTYYPGPVPSLTRLDADEEHTRPGRQMLLKGDTSTRLQTWDSVQSLDYLASHPLVDPKRLASTGQSGGGTNTMLLAAIDDRIAAAAISCPNTENVACKGFIPPGSTDDAEQNLLASGSAGFDRWDLLYPLAPKPLLVLVSERDAFGTYSPNYILNGLEEFEKLQKVYAVLGHADRIEWHGTPLPHGLAYEMRLRIYNWFERWLNGNNRRIEDEPPTSPEPDATLFVTESGSLVQSLHSETPFSLNRKRRIEKTPGDLGRLLGVERQGNLRAPATLSVTTFRNVRIEALEFGSAPKVWVPAWLFLPKKKKEDEPLVVILEPGGRQRWQENAMYDQLASEGCAVCAADVRGVGDMAPEFGRAAAHYAATHHDEEQWAWSSLILGSPLLGQRVTDLLSVVSGLRARPDLNGHRLIVAARGPLTVPALFSTALSKSIDGLYLAGGLISFESFANTENYNYPFANIIPNLLEHADLPDLAASAAPRRVTLAGAIDATGKRLTPDEVRSDYRELPHVRVLPNPSWTATAILKSFRDG
jgi:cephalosporin-C deacetylase-like acetyl esterase